MCRKASRDDCDPCLTAPLWSSHLNQEHPAVDHYTTCGRKCPLYRYTMIQRAPRICDRQARLPAAAPLPDVIRRTQPMPTPPSDPVSPSSTSTKPASRHARVNTSTSTLVKQRRRDAPPQLSHFLHHKLDARLGLLYVHDAGRQVGRLLQCVELHLLLIAQRACTQAYLRMACFNRPLGSRQGARTQRARSIRTQEARALRPHPEARSECAHRYRRC